jgi:hypothetical protein
MSRTSLSLDYVLRFGPTYKSHKNSSERQVKLKTQRFDINRLGNPYFAITIEF